MSKNTLKTKGFFITSFFIILLMAFVTLFVSLVFVEPLAYNYMIKEQTASVRTGSDDILIIAIDDKSISYHRWPWSRDYYGKIFKYLKMYTNAKVIGFDSVVQNLDKDHPQADKMFFDTVKNTENLVVGFAPLRVGAFDEVRNNAYNNKFHNKFGTEVVITPGNEITHSFYKGISEYPVEYFNAVKNNGSVNHILDVNGYLVQIPQIVSVNGNYYPSISLKMYMYANGVKTISADDKFITATGTGLRIPYQYNPKNSVSAGFLSNIRYYKLRPNSEYSHKKYSASDIIRSYDNLQNGLPPIINPKEFDEKYVFLGANAKAAATSLEDVSKTPIQEKHPGVDIQATNLDNILHNDFLTENKGYQNLLIIFAISIFTVLCVAKLSILLSLIVNAFVVIAYIIIAIISFKNGHVIWLATPIMFQIMSNIFGYSYKFINENKNKEKIKQAMGKYLSQDIMKNVVQNIDDIKLGGKRANVTVLFADIRGFTSMSEKMTAEEVSKILNEYFTEIEPIITGYNGVINKFIGDAVMAIFGEPIQDLNHPVNAVKCAYAMLKKVEQLQDKWLFEGKPKIEIGIGINTGEAFVGNIGSEKRLEYTVIGDTVNLASRIESYNKIYHTNLLVSSSTYSYISDIANVIKISDVTIRGKSKKMDIYEILKLNFEK